MKNSLFFKLLVLLCLVGWNNATRAQVLQTGDVLKKDVTGTAVNYSKGKLSLSDFKDKAIIIDFWATWCGSCVAEFSKLDSLQKIYKDDLQIILVTRESEERIAKFFKPNKLFKHLTLPSIVNDQELNNLFPHRTIPHEVWISKERKVMAITSHREVNGSNIEQFIQNRKFSFEPKIDVLNHNREKPFLINNNGGTNERIFSSSVLSGRQAGLGSFMKAKQDSLGRYIGISAVNVDLLRLLTVAYGKFNFRAMTLNRTIFDVKDSTPLHSPKGQSVEWMAKNFFCYDLHVAKPAKDLDGICSVMQQELRRKFPYYAKVEKRDMECLVLQQTSVKNKYASKGGVAEVSIVGPGSYRLRNAPLSALITLLNDLPSNTPYVVNETGFSGNVDVELGNKQFLYRDRIDIGVLNESLKRYDLEFVKKKALIDVLVICQD